MTHAHTTSRRLPRKSCGFSWGRLPMRDGIVIYRLFRRDCRGGLHMLAVQFIIGEDRRYLARRLLDARRQLRDHVDAIDLQAMGVAA